MSRAVPTLCVLALLFPSVAFADIPFSQSEVWSGPQFIEDDARRERLELQAAELEAQIEQAQTDAEKEVLRSALADVQAEHTKLTRLPEELWPANDKLVERLELLDDVPGRYDPEPITVEQARHLCLLFHEPSLGHPRMDARWQDHLLGEMTRAGSHPALSPEAAAALRDGYIEYVNTLSQYYSPAEIMVSISVMGEIAEGLMRVSEPNDREARAIADDMAARVLAWTEHLQRHDEHARYADILGGLAETSQLLEESSPDWIEADRSHPKAADIQRMVTETKRAARRDNRDLKQMQDVITLGQADYGRADWNASSVRMQLILIRRVLMKPRRTVSAEVVAYLGETLRQYPEGGRLSTRELKRLWRKAVQVLFLRAETLAEVTFNQKLAETDLRRTGVEADLMSDLLRSYATILRKDASRVEHEVVRRVDRALLDLAKEGTKLTTRDHWVLWSRAAAALKKPRASKELMGFILERLEKEKDPMRLATYRRAGRALGVRA